MTVDGITYLHIGDTLSLPIDAAAGRFVILGKSGAGKTNGDTVFAEELIRAGIPVFILDPLGNMWGLRSSADGESQGLPVVIFGGLHADVKIEAFDGGRIAEMLSSKGIPAVIDLSEFTIEDQRGFAADFCGKLIHCVTDVVHVVLEEADRFAPNTIGKNPVKTFARTSRNKGIGWTFSTQRPQILSPEVIESSSVIIAMKMTGELAQEAIGKESKSRIGTKRTREIIAQLPTLRRGQAWFIPDTDWLPDTPDDVEAEPMQFRFRLRETFDSARPPKVGDQVREPKVLAAINLDEIRNALEIPDDDEDASSADVADLHTRIGELEETRSLLEQRIVEIEARAELPKLDEIRARIEEAQALWEKILADATSIRVDLYAIAAYGASDAIAAFGANDEEPALTKTPEKITSPRRDAPTDSRVSTTEGLTRYERQLLEALVRRLPAKWTAPGFLGALAGKSPKSSAFTGTLRSLRDRQAIEVERGNIGITKAGIELIGARPPARPLTEAQAVEVWSGALGRVPGAILQAVVSAGPRGLSRAEISEQTGYSITSSSFTGALRELATNNLIAQAGTQFRSRVGEQLR